MSVPVAHNTSTLNTSTYRTIVSSEPANNTTYRTFSVSSDPASLSPLPYAVNGSGYETVRYLVPMQQQPVQQSYVLVNSAHQVQAMPQMMYMQTVPRVSVGSLEESGIVYQQQVVEQNHNGRTPSVFSQASSPGIKSPEPSVEEEEEEEDEEEEEEEVVVKEAVKEKVVVEVRSEAAAAGGVVKMDTRFFGELLAEVHRKNCDIHACISEHVAKIRGRKHLLDPSNDYKVEKDEVEALIPRGASELTKQQIRYLLQTRLTADKSMRLLLTTFSSLREELVHLTEDLRRLDSEKDSLERDLSFKADQAQQYDRLLEAVRENNRQLQLSLKESISAQRSLESQLLTSRTTDSGRDFRVKELEGSLRVLEKEKEMLRQKLAGQGSSSSLQLKTEELSRQYSQQLSSLRQDKDKELQSLRSQITRIQTEYSTDRSGDQSLKLRITELLTSLEQRDGVIRRQEEDIRRLQQEKTDSARNVTKTTITKRYRNQYPILGLLSDDYQASCHIKDNKTIVIEKQTGEIVKQEIITTP